MQREKLELQQETQRLVQDITDRLRELLREQGFSEDSIPAMLERIIPPVDNA
jgi:hypothetical protein